MRVCHVVALTSSDGAYGGPVRVAENLCGELLRRGEDASILSGFLPTDNRTVGRGQLPRSTFSARFVLPGQGFAGLMSPGVARALWRRRREIDVAHVHLARDLTTLPAALVARLGCIPYVVQTHGMIDPSSKALAAPLDLVATRPVLRAAGRVLALTEQEVSDLRAVAGPGIATTVLPNGVQVHEASPAREQDQVDVLFLARLHPRKRPLAFVDIARQLTDTASSRVSFSIVGPDDGCAPEVETAVAATARSSIRFEGSLPPDATRDRMRRADVYVLPAVDEPFPMAVLEAMAEGLPVVVCRSNGLAALVESSGAGTVVDDDDTVGMTRAVASLIDDPDLRRSMGSRGRRAVGEKLSVTTVVDQLTEIYDEVLSAYRRRG